MTDQPIYQLTPEDRRRAFKSLVAVPPILALLLFLPAGHLNWGRGWLFLAVFCGVTAIAVAILWRVNPEIFPARRRIQPGTRRWDRVLLALLAPLLLLLIIVAGLDDGRYHWSAMPTSVVLIGYVLWLLGFAVATWAQGVNRHFEPGVRIQTERHHTVIDSGPYAYLRHPGYAGALLLMVGVALSLGSWWALVPALIASVVLLVRTRWEDDMLIEELPGYRAYAARVRWRLAPGLW
jgi:protein-S-isoprenylcysteine O-methyltransferase Ste14